MAASLPDTVFMAMKQQATSSGLAEAFCGENGKREFVSLLWTLME